MKNLDWEKILVTSAATFMLMFGITTSVAPIEFVSGCFTGAVTMFSVAMWVSPDNTEEFK